MGRIKLSVGLILVCVFKCMAMSYSELEDFAEYLKKTSQLSPTLKKGAQPDDYDEDELVSDHAWEESGKFEGDLILNERQRRLIVENIAEGLSRNGIRDGSKRWPNNEVIYYIQVEHFTGDQVQAIQDGIDDIARASCIKFRRYVKGDRDAVVIQGSRRGCFSQVGYQGGYQVLNLSGRHPVGRGCFRHGTVVHELLHTLGFYHMQSSPDRDDYVNVIWENIIQPARHNFRKYNSFSVSDFGVGYDYDSVLHYSRRAFSANGQDTIVPKKSGAEIGQRVGLSDKDTQKLNKMYCDADSDQVQADENIPKKNKKKITKNIPFEGHGIGYHQGKAVAIKLLPSPETFTLPDVPSSYIFDYFSKTPQILSTPENESFRANKEITYSYSPYEALTTQGYKNSVDTEIIMSSNDKDVHPQNHHPDRHTDLKVTEMDHDIVKKDDVVDKKDTPEESTNNEDNTDGKALIDRLSKIIKHHVYPSHGPDFSIYKTFAQHPKIEHAVEKSKHDNDESVTESPLKQEKKVSKPTMGFADTYESIKKNDHYYTKPVTGAYYEDEREQITRDSDYKSEDEHRKYINPPLSMALTIRDDVQHRIPSSQISSQHYRGELENEKYSLNKSENDKTHRSHDEWHQQYTPFKYNPYTYYGSSDSVEHDYKDNIYRTPDATKKKEYLYSDPFPSDEHNNVSHEDDR